jgi:phosphoribosylamine--glycine ligase
MNILILGSGGREHAFTLKIKESPLCNKLFVAPGNAGISEIAICVDLSVIDFESIKSFVINENIQMVVVGPEDPLVNGIYDFFKNDDLLKDIAVIGPSKEAAQLEGSKDFAKIFLEENHIPTARYKSFNASTLNHGYAFLESLSPPYVLKADGLAAGKGVVILDNLNEAKAELKRMLADQKFGKASEKVVIEEFLSGIEMSCFVLTDGKNYKILPFAKDYKRIGEGDTGLNTGGMGAISPVAFVDEKMYNKIEERIVKPTILGLQRRQMTYIGFVFIGLINVNGEPYVIEYNVRMGDPETEVVLPRLNSDLVNIFNKMTEGKLNEINLEINPDTAATVILVSGGYPEDYQKGYEINGLNEKFNSLVFHSGTKWLNGKAVTNGGRVLAITSLGKTINEATSKSYETIKQINFDKMYFRKDIGKDLENFL